MKKDKRQIEIKDIPSIYIDIYDFDGSLEKVSKNILGIKDRLKIAYDERKKLYPTADFSPFEQYEDIRLNIYQDYDGIDVTINVYRTETDKEYKDRMKKQKEANEKAAKKREETAKKQKEALREKELKLLKQLKKKYEKNS